MQLMVPTFDITEENDPAELWQHLIAGLNEEERLLKQRITHYLLYFLMYTIVIYIRFVAICQ